MLDVARWLVFERGLSVIPLDHPHAPVAKKPEQVGKVPTLSSWKAFQQSAPGDANLSAWFGGDTPHNIGIVTGAVSGVVVIDCDSPEADAWADQHLPPTSMMTLTSRGTQRFYRHPGGVIKNGVKIGNLALDVRGDGGYVVAPTSLHRSGVTYQRVGEWPEIERLPLFDPAWLAQKKAVEPPSGATVRDDGRDASSHGRDERIRRVRAYLDKVPGAVQGQSGDHATYVVACRVVRDFGLSDADAFDVLCEWNSKCEPPWSDAELRDKVANARQYGQGTVGGALWSSSRRNAADHDTDRPVLDPAAPLDSAHAFIDRHHLNGGFITLRHHRGEFCRFERTQNVYVDVEDDAVRAEVYEFLEAADIIDDRGRLRPFNPTRSKVDNVMDALRAVTLLNVPGAPIWLDNEHGDLDPFDILPAVNGLLHLPTRTLIPPTPAFFARTGVPFAFDPDAPRPEAWLAFLQQLWPHDAESVSALREYMGYTLTHRTEQQKMLMIIGPKRAGKGTIARVWCELRGKANVCAPTLAAMATQFGLAPLINKPLAVIADARIGGRTDATAMVERLLSISGEDAQSIPRKFLPDWIGTLPTRFVLLSNELPRVRDSAGAFISRFVVLTLTRSFYGVEDPALSNKLMLELPSILNWALDGLESLRLRGHFVQPASANSIVSEFEALSSPITAFVNDRCMIEPGATVLPESLYAEWRSWCDQNGHENVGTIHVFGRDLRAAVPSLDDTRPKLDGGRIRLYRGIRLALPAERGIA